MGEEKVRRGEGERGEGERGEGERGERWFGKERERGVDRKRDGRGWVKRELKRRDRRG